MLFGRAAEWYLANIPILENCWIKSQSWQVTSKLVKAGILTMERVQGAEWTTKSDKKTYKSTK